ANSVPVGSELFDLEQRGDAVQPVVRGKATRDVFVELGQPPSLLEATAGEVAWDRTPVDIGDVVWVGDVVEQLEPPLGPLAGLVVASLREEGVRQSLVGVRAQFNVGQALGDVARLSCSRFRIAWTAVRARDQRPRAPRGLEGRELERPRDPAF